MSVGNSHRGLVAALVQAVFYQWLESFSLLEAYPSLKVGLSPSKIICFICFNESFLYHMGTSFRFQDIQFFVLTFCSCKKRLD